MLSPSEALSYAHEHLLSPTELTEQALAGLMGQAMAGKGVDYADFYFQLTHQEGWALENGVVKSGSFAIDKGVGVRVLKGESVGFAYSEDLSLPVLSQAVQASRSISQQQHPRPLQVQPTHSSMHLYDAANPLTTMDEKAKVDILHALHDYAHQADSRVIQVNAQLGGEYDVVCVLNNEGCLRAEIRPLVRLAITVVVEDKQGRKESGFMGGGGRHLYQQFIDDGLTQAYAEEAVRRAVVNLSAQPAPAGTMPVVLGAGSPGILLHEAVGHGLEGDFNRKGSSAFSGRVGEQVASAQCTIVDDGTLPGRRGSLHMDDEGHPTAHNVLIENGILRGYMQDQRNARLMGVPTTGNGRRESYECLPMPRMTNTYMLAGESSPEEIIASVDKGIYAVEFGSGQVDISSGKFVFAASEAYLIDNGKIGPAIKGAMLVGNGPETLMQISMVGNDLQMDSGVGTCGKDGQSVPVGVGQPTMRVDALTVGGTEFN